MNLKLAFALFSGLIAASIQTPTLYKNNSKENEIFGKERSEADKQKYKDWKVSSHG